MVISRIESVNDALDGMTALVVFSSCCSLVVIVARTSGNVSTLQLNGNYPQSVIAFQFLSNLTKLLTHVVFTIGIIL